MTINLITPEQHETLLNIYTNYPALSLQNTGYEGIDRSKFTDEEKAADAKVNEMLSKSILGFTRFQNFRLSKEGIVSLRIQYDYNADYVKKYEYDPNGIRPFTGVGYINLDELLNGFVD